MPTFALLRLERHFQPADYLAGVSIHPVPMARVNGKPLTIEAESPELALAMGIRQFPFFRFSLATQEISEYEQQHPHFAFPADAGRVLRSAKTRSPYPQSPAPIRGEHPPG